MMGSILPTLKGVVMQKEERIPYDPEDLNGRKLNDIFIAPELLVDILCMVDGKTLVRSCRLVCKAWQEIIENPLLWHDKCKMDKIPLPVLDDALISELDWKFYPLTYLKNPYGRSLLRNGSGQSNLHNWKVVSRGGDGWKVENPPGGCEELPAEITERDGCYCFATSYHSCSKEQVIDLFEEGILPELLDADVLSITIEDWYAGRFDCGCVYELQVHLLDDSGQQILDVESKFETRLTVEQWQGSTWHKVDHTFRDLRGVKFVKFYHGGADTQFWAGHYGSKMAGAAVYVKSKN